MIKIALVGFGGMGQVHFANYKKIQGCQVVATVNKSPAGREKALEVGIAYYEDLETLLKNEEIDLVDICTPTYLHKTHVMKALEQGKHVMVEKPMALHIEDVLEMFAYAKEKGKQIYVAQVVQFTKETEVLRRFVESGELGLVLDGYFERVAGMPEWSQGNWLFDRHKSGVIPFDLHIHDLDLIISLFGSPQKYSFTSSGGKEGEMKEQYRFTYDFDDFHLVAEAAWYNVDFPFLARWRIYFERGLLVFDGKNLTLYQKHLDPMVFDLSEEFVVSTGINLPPTGMFYRELSHFMECIKENRPSERVTREQIIGSIEILENIVFTNPEIDEA